MFRTKGRFSLRVALLSFVLSGCAANQTGYETAPVSANEKTGSTEIQRAVKSIQNLKSWPDAVLETSGLAYFSKYFWTINDSGDGPYVYAIDQSQQLMGKVRIAGARNIDWEALAQDQQHLYVADCGNNRGKRSSLQIYKIPKGTLVDALENKTSPLVSTEVLQIRYANKPEKVPAKAHNFDCEAIAIVDDELWLFTKNRGDLKTNLYRFDKSAAIQTQPIARSFAVNGLITDADFNPATGRLLLLGYSKNRLFGQSFVWQLPTKKASTGQREILWQQARLMRLTPYAQWEAIIWDRRSRAPKAILSSEKSPLLDVSIGELLLDNR